jgi:hypothetical protein
MDLIMFHSGEQLPEYLKYTFKQFRLFNPDVKVHFLTDKIFLKNEIFKTYNINAVDKDYYYSRKIEEIQNCFTRKANDFWMITITRLIYFENYINQHSLENVYHFENDVLIYHTLEEHDEQFKRLFPYLAITIGGNDKAMTGFMFIKNVIGISLMTRYFISILKKYGEKGIIKHYGVDMVHEMSLMRIYNKDKGEKYLSSLPSLLTSLYFPEFLSLYDPAAFGQYVGGTRNEGPGAKPTDHYISQLMIEHPEYDVIWEKDEKNRKIPYFDMRNFKTKINNLHIHSKNLHLYVS